MKLTVSLEETDLKVLKEYLSAHGTLAGTQHTLALTRIAATITELLDTDALVDAKVTALLSRMSSIPAEVIKNEHKLGFHLGLGPTRIKALAGPLTLVAQSIKANAKAVTTTESSQLDTVQACIDLVKKKLQ